MFNLYPNLPGILTEFKDGGLQLRNDPNPPPTESLLLLGTAVDGPVGVPVAVDASTVEVVFGKAVDKNGKPNGATLVVGFEEAWNAGCRDIRLMRISGKPATAFAECEAVTTLKEELIEDILGLASGNTEMTIDLEAELGLSELDENWQIAADTVMVYADGLSLPQDAYSVDYTAKTVTINSDVCSVGAAITINFTAIVDGEQMPSSVGVAATGRDMSYTLSKVPIGGTVMVYAGDDALDASQYTLNGTQLTVKAGAAPLGVELKARYLAQNNVVVDQKGIKISTINAGSLYNDAKLYVEAVINSEGKVIGKKLVLEKPAAKRATGEQPLEYSSLDYQTIEAMVNAINSDPNNNIFRAEADAEILEQSSFLLKVTGPEGIQFSGGDDELKLSKTRMFELLSGKRDANGNLIEPGAYQLLENYTVDWIVPLGVYADDELPDPKKSFAQELAMACAYISTRQHTTYGVIATKPAAGTDLKSIETHVNKLLARKNDYFVLDKFGHPILDEEGKPYDIGRFIHVVAGPEVILRNSRLGTYTANSAVIFAAMMTTMRPGSSPLNKQVPGILGLRYSYSNTQRDRLTAARYVTYKTKANGTIVAVEDAMTCAQPGSDYARTTTVRVVKAAVDAVKDACDPFLGEPNNIPNRNAMAAAIDKRLNAMKEAGDLSDYRFNIVSTLMDQVLGRAKIELTLVPPFELRQITVVVSLTPEL